MTDDQYINRFLEEIRKAVENRGFIDFKEEIEAILNKVYQDGFTDGYNESEEKRD